MRKEKLAIITTHPVQYNAPLFQLLAKENSFSIKVFYTWGKQSQGAKYDPDFDKEISWDIPLLEGYDYSFVTNISKSPGSHHFNGINNPTLIKEVEEWQATAVFVYGWSYHSHLKAMRYFKNKIPVLFRGDSTMLNEASANIFKKTLRRIFLTWVYRHIDYALYVGSANKNYFLKHGVRPSELVFAPHAVDNNRFTQNEQEHCRSAQQLRSSLGILENEIVFLFAGKFEPRKAPEFLIEAFRSLNTGNIHLIMVGNGKMEDELKMMANGVKHIHWMDFQNQSMMPVVYRLGDIFILPSRSETWGLSVNEAMACKRAILISDKSGCAPDLVVPGKNGFIFEFGNINDLIKKIKVMADKSLVKKMGVSSYEIIADWSYSKIVDSVKHIFQRRAHD